VLQSFEFRFSKPVFVGDAIEVQGTPDGAAAKLEVVSGSGVHAAASAAWA
jgi:3-methylfumaryl-CoA hydratase